MRSSPVVECVPNISEGRDARLLDKLQASIVGVRFLDRSSDPDHNRTVFTFAGGPEAVFAASMNLAEAAVRLLSLSNHKGVHPRIGVLDVLPFVPVSQVSLEDCAALAHRAAKVLWEEFGLPSYFYGAAGIDPLEEVRRQAGRKAAPHTGAGTHPTAGAAAVGARPFLIAWNVWLETADLTVARRIAAAIRASSGGFAGVKALGLPLSSRELVQVSINTVDYRATPLHLVFETVNALAKKSGIAVRGCELIGLIPEEAVRLSQGHDLCWMNWREDAIFERRYSRESVSNPCS